MLMSYRPRWPFRQSHQNCDDELPSEAADQGKVTRCADELPFQAADRGKVTRNVLMSYLPKRLVRAMSPDLS